MPSIVFCLVFSCSRWFPASFPFRLCRLQLGRPLDLFPLIGCRSVQRLVHLLPFILAIYLAHFFFAVLFLCEVYHVSHLYHYDRLAGLVVKASSSGVEDPGFESRFSRDFSGWSHTSDTKIGTPVATLPGAWHYRVSTGTGRPGVSIP